MPFQISSVRPIDPMITSFMQEYSNEDFCAEKVFPIVPVKGESGTYFVFGKNRFQVPNTQRGINTRYTRINMDINSATYRTQENAVEIPIDKRIQENALSPMDPVRSATLTVMDIINLRRDIDLITQLTDTTNNYPTNHATVPAAKRFDQPAADPIAYMNVICELVKLGCGRWPNTGVMSWDTFLALKTNPAIVERLKYTELKIVNEGILAQLFSLEKLILVRDVYNSAGDGLTVSLAELMPAGFWVGWVNPSPAIDRPSAGYLIQSRPPQGKTYYEDQTNSDIVQGSVIEVPKIVAEDCGYILGTCIG